MATYGWKGKLPVSGEIVVVEDDDILREVLEDALSDLRAKVVIFSTADAAFKHVLDSHGHCSVLITDHGVPGRLNGTQLAETFRAKWPSIGLIVTSGYALDPESLPRDTVYLQKPWAINQLISAIAMLVQPGVPVSAI